MCGKSRSLNVLKLGQWTQAFNSVINVLARREGPLYSFQIDLNVFIIIELLGSVHFVYHRLISIVSRCGCDECVTSQTTDSLRHSQSRINAYRALSASSLIALSSRDPVLTAFQLSWELKRLQAMESEFRAEYTVR